MADLAVLGPVDTNVSPVVFAKGEDVGIGSDVYLIGYPGDQGGSPEPTIARGIVTRIRDWPAIDMTYVETDVRVQ